MSPLGDKKNHTGHYGAEANEVIKIGIAKGRRVNHHPESLTGSYFFKRVRTH